MPGHKIWASEFDRRADAKHRGVGNTVRRRIDWIERAAAPMKDLLEIRLDEKARDDLRLIGQFEGNLIVADRQGGRRKERRIGVASARLGRDPLIGSRRPERIVWPYIPEPNKIDARVGIEINEVTV